VPADFDLKELCERARVTPRTVHYYIQQGLLAPAGTVGPGARYTDDHLNRLQLIRLLQNEHLPLAEINRRLRRLSGDDVRRLVEGKKGSDAPRGSALDYIRGVLNQEPARATAMRAATTPSPDPDGSPSETVLGRSQWERIDLSESIELNVRRPLTRPQQRKLEKLLNAARAIFEEPDI
jgi:DNA-binding transcriptional MerR regulator